MLGLAYISFIYRIDKQQGHTVNYREHIQYPMINNNRKNITKRMNHLVQHKNEHSLNKQYFNKNAKTENKTLKIELSYDLATSLLIYIQRKL